MCFRKIKGVEFFNSEQYEIAMNKLIVKNVGPIKNGAGDAFIEINRLTIFLGPQGSGKSTLAKIYSSLLWLEKAIVREEVSVEQCQKAGYFLKEVISYQGVQSYFKENSYIHFIGKACEFKLKSGRFSVTRLPENADFLMPKIMYVPAERNFLTSIPKVEYIEGLPKPLATFLKEYEHAKQWAQSRNEVHIPIGELSFKYSEKEAASLLVGDGYETNLLHGSSGYQSYVPLFLVTEFLSNYVLNRTDDPSHELYSEVQKRNIVDRFIKITKSLSSDDSAASTSTEKQLLKLLGQYDYGSFVNIVEEPEQNLHPESQRKALFGLIQHLNKIADNQLLITSHSPYILSYVALCIEAKKALERVWGVLGEGLAAIDLTGKIRNVVPESAEVSLEETNVYILDDYGNVRFLDKSEGYISEEHSLNSVFDDVSENISALLDLG